MCEICDNESFDAADCVHSETFCNDPVLHLCCFPKAKKKGAAAGTASIMVAGFPSSTRPLNAGMGRGFLRRWFFVAHLTKIKLCLQNRVLRLVGSSGVVPHAEPRPAAMAWKDDERFAVHAANGGLDVILCPAHFLYLDIVQDFNFEDKSLCPQQVWCLILVWKVEILGRCKHLDRLCRPFHNNTTRLFIYSEGSLLGSSCIATPPCL